MGVKIMRFATLEGDEIKVTFTGANVTDGELIPAADPVTMQMDGGGGEYKAVKFATASVSCLVDGIQLLDVYAQQPLDVAVKIENVSKGTTLFAGYVSPNTYNQTITGINDTLTIECADWLGISQYVPYKRVDTTFPTYTLAAIMQRLASLISADDCRDIYIADSVRIVSGNGGNDTTHYYSLQLTDAYFFENPNEPTVDDEGNVSWETQAISCFDALTYIAESFRMVLVQEGDALYMLDPVQMHSGSSRLYRLSDLAVVTDDCQRLDIVEETMRSTGASISVLPRVSQVVLQQKEGAPKASINFLSDDMLTRYLDMTHTTEVDANNSNKATVHFSQTLQSKVLDVNNYSSAAVGPATQACLVACKNVQTYRNSVTPDNPALYTRWGDGKDWANYLRVFCPQGAAGATICSLKAPYRFSVVPSRYMFLKLKVSAAVTHYTNDLAPRELIKDTNILLFATVRCGELYYNSDLDTWTAARFLIPVNIFGDGEWKTSCSVQTAKLPPNALTSSTVAGDINIELVSGYSPSSETEVFYIKEFQLEVAVNPLVDMAKAYNPKPEELRLGTFDYNAEAEEVSLPLSFGFPMGERPFSTQIEGVEYAQIIGATDPTTGWNIPFDIRATMLFAPSAEAEVDECDTMLQRLYRLANLGDGYELQLPINDEGNNVASTTLVTSPLWQGYKIVVAFEKSLINNTVTVTLN